MADVKFDAPQEKPKILSSPSCCSMTRVLVLSALAIALFSIISYFTELSPAEVFYGGASLSFVLMILACVCNPKNRVIQKMIPGKTAIQKFSLNAPPRVLMDAFTPPEFEAIKKRNLGLIYIENGLSGPRAYDIFYFNHSADAYTFNDLLKRYLAFQFIPNEQAVKNGTAIFGVIDFDMWKDACPHKIETRRGSDFNTVPTLGLRDIAGDSAIYTVGFTQLDCTHADLSKQFLFHFVHQFLCDQSGGKTAPGLLFQGPVTSKGS